MFQLEDKIKLFFERYPKYKDLIDSNLKGDIVFSNENYFFEGSEENLLKLKNIVYKTFRDRER